MINDYFAKINKTISSFLPIIKTYTKSEKVYSQNKGYIRGKIVFNDNCVLSFMELKDTEKTDKKPSMIIANTTNPATALRRTFCLSSPEHLMKWRMFMIRKWTIKKGKAKDLLKYARAPKIPQRIPLVRRF